MTQETVLTEESAEESEWQNDPRGIIEGLAARLSSVTDRVLVLEQQSVPDEKGSWQKQPDLIDKQFRPVLGIHTGGGSDPALIAERMGQRIQAAPLYWKKTDSPAAACQKKLNHGTIPRLELCLPHIFTSTGARMPSDGESFWARAADGQYDQGLISLLDEVGSLDQAILLSACHEGDLRSEDGASPKSENPSKTDYCGDWEEFPAFWERFAKKARKHAPKARLFLNFSGGYEDSPSRWAKMLPPAGTFDFFGWDPYSQYGKYGNTDWNTFEERFTLFGRWDWYKETIPDVPIIVGETGVCAGPDPGGKKDAGKWLLEMVDFMHENRWQGVGTGGGISQIHYFSHHYDAHPRCIDDNGSHKQCDAGQKWSALPKIGADTRLAWAAD
jgi:hypothetical protein